MPAPHALSVTTHVLAARHEAVYLRLSALRRDIGAIAAKRPTAPVSEAVRVVAAGLIRDCAGFGRQRGEKLPEVATDLAGLAVQLGQAQARLDVFENQHAFWDTRLKARAWRVRPDPIPVMRLQPEITHAGPRNWKGEDLRAKLIKLHQAENREQALSDYERGFAAGRAARIGPPPPDEPAGPGAG